MVFSQLCLHKSHGLGTAKAIGCKRTVLSIDELITEAEFLWAAERFCCKRDGKLSTAWGCVALLPNPNGKIPRKMLKNWKERVSKESKYGRLCHSKSETSIVNHAGILQIPWPNTVHGDSLSFDLLLATATNPTLKGNPLVYPRIRQIARAWKQDTEENEKYFRQNQKHDICTYQDELIVQHMQSRGPI